jgi:hypothetical protein
MPMMPADMNVKSWHVDIDLSCGRRRAANRHCADEAKSQGKSCYRMHGSPPVSGEK